MTRAWPLKPAMSFIHELQLTFSASVDQRLQALLVLHVHHGHQSGVDPPARGDGVQSRDDDLELHVERQRVVLDLAKVWRHLHAGHPLHYELSRHKRLRLANIGFTVRQPPRIGMLTGRGTVGSGSRYQ